MSSLSDVITAARELAFDRFVTPTVLISSTKLNYKLDIDQNGLKVSDYSDSNNPVVKTNLDFATYTTLQSIVNALMIDPEKYAISYSASFIGSEPSNSFLPLSGADLSGIVPIYRQYFFSDSYITTNFIEDYYLTILGANPDDVATADYSVEVPLLPRPQDRHLTIWVAYRMVEKRRLYEFSASAMGNQSTFSQTGDAALFVSPDGQDTIQMKVGDVFSLSTNPINQDARDRELGNSVGVDNLLDDFNSFWYRLQLTLRDMFERLFGDFSLRPNQVMFGQMELEKQTNVYAYYDNYPYTLSAIARGIISNVQ